MTQWGKQMNRRVGFKAGPFEQLQVQQQAAAVALKATHAKLLAAGFTLDVTGCYVAPDGVSCIELLEILRCANLATSLQPALPSS